MSGTTSQATVRQATEEDAAAISRICSEAYRVTYAGLLPDEYIERTIADFYNLPRVTREVRPAPPRWFGYQVVQEEGTVLGAAGGGMTGDHRGELFVVYLDPEQRNRGLGTLLLDRVTEQLRQAGATEMWVGVTPGNQRALPFYEARGFQLVETVKAYGSRDEDDVRSLRMRRALPASAVPGA
jgi:ribosomal protein S18 acetylase RimI-like enzyme